MAAHDPGVHLPRHPSILGTLPLSKPPMPSNPPRLVQFSGAGARMHRDLLANDEAIGDELADRLAGVGVGDLINFVRVERDLALAAVGHGRREALLRAEINPVVGSRKFSLMMLVDGAGEGFACMVERLGTPIQHTQSLCKMLQ